MQNKKSARGALFYWFFLIFYADYGMLLYIIKKGVKEI